VHPVPPVCIPERLNETPSAYFPPRKSLPSLFLPLPLFFHSSPAFPMKLSASLAFVTAAVSTASAQIINPPTANTTDVGPVVTLTTPAAIPGGKGIISGTAKDTGSGTGGTGGTATTAGVREVLWQFEGDTKWRKATLALPNAAETTFFFEVKITGSYGRRIYVRAVDVYRGEGDIVGRRFRKGS